MTDLQALTELCQEIRNWFQREIYTGRITIAEGEITLADGTAPALADRQYYRIVGSIFSDGVHQSGIDDQQLADESFDGALWYMAVPPPVISLAADIKAWRDTYEAADSQAMSPFASESFGGYSYTKSSGRSDGSDTGGVGWQSAFKARMNAWRKIL